MNIVWILICVLFAGFFAILAWHKRSWAIYILLLLLPSYLIRFSIGPLPSTYLEILLLLLIVTFFVREII